MKNTNKLTFMEEVQNAIGCFEFLMKEVKTQLKENTIVTNSLLETESVLEDCEQTLEFLYSISNNKEPVIVVTETETDLDLEKHWSYPLEEIPYVIEQIKDGDRCNGYEFFLHNNRLYENEETEIV